MGVVQYRATEDHEEQFNLCCPLDKQSTGKTVKKAYSIIKEYQRSRNYGACVCSDGTLIMTRTNKVL